MQPYLGQIVHYHDPNVWDNQTYTTRAAIVTEVTDDGVRLLVLYPTHKRAWPNDPPPLFAVHWLVQFAPEPRLGCWSPAVPSSPRVTGGRLGPDQEPATGWPRAGRFTHDDPVGPDCFGGSDDPEAGL